MGLTIDTTKGDISKAVLDSTNYEMKLNIDLMNEDGMGMREFRAVGGGAKSGRWLQMKADCFAMPVSSMQVSEAASLGAAMLGGVAAGTFRDAGEAAGCMVRIKDTYHPDESRSKRHQEKYAEYRDLYPVLREYSHRLAGS